MGKAKGNFRYLKVRRLSTLWSKFRYWENQKKGIRWKDPSYSDSNNSVNSVKYTMRSLVVLCHERFFGSFWIHQEEIEFKFYLYKTSQLTLSSKTQITSGWGVSCREVSVFAKTINVEVEKLIFQVNEVCLQIGCIGHLHHVKTSKSVYAGAGWNCTIVSMAPIWIARFAGLSWVNCAGCLVYCSNERLQAAPSACGPQSFVLRQLTIILC